MEPPNPPKTTRSLDTVITVSARMTVRNYYKYRCNGSWNLVRAGNREAGYAMAHDLLSKPDLPDVQKAVLHLVLSTGETSQLRHAENALALMLSVYDEDPNDEFFTGYLELCYKAVGFWNERARAAAANKMDEDSQARNFDRYLERLLRDTEKLSLLEGKKVEMTDSSAPKIDYDVGTQVFDAHRSGRAKNQNAFSALTLQSANLHKRKASTDIPVFANFTPKKLDFRPLLPLTPRPRPRAPDSPTPLRASSSSFRIEEVSPTRPMPAVWAPEPDMFDPFYDEGEYDMAGGT